MRRSLGRCLGPADAVSLVFGRSTAAAAATWRIMGEAAAGQQVKQTFYARTGTAVAFIISERESVPIAMAALMSTAGEQFTSTPGFKPRVTRATHQ